MARKPFTIELDPQVDKLLFDEKKALLKLLSEEPAKFDVSPRAVAHKALTDRIYKRLTKYPDLFSFPLRAPHQNYRCVDTWGWRLIIEIDYDNSVVKAFYLASIKTPIPNVEQTLEELDRYLKSRGK
jgi:hypothetical protein